MMTDIEIAQQCRMHPTADIAATAGIDESYLEQYGRYKAKLLPSATAGKPQTGKLILVTAINPTAAGEGKTTTSIGLADSLSALGKKTVLALRERYQEVTVEAAIPCPTQADAWPEAERERYRELVARCDMETMGSDTNSSTCMQRRDRYMVDHAALLIAAFDGSPGGTRYTVEYAMRRGLEIVDLPIVLEPAR